MERERERGQHIISLYRIVVLKRQNRLKVGTDKSKLKVKMQSVSDDDVQISVVRCIIEIQES